MPDEALEINGLGKMFPHRLQPHLYQTGVHDLVPVGSRYAILYRPHDQAAALIQVLDQVFFGLINDSGKRAASYLNNGSGSHNAAFGSNHAAG